MTMTERVRRRQHKCVCRRRRLPTRPPAQELYTRGFARGLLTSLISSWCGRGVSRRSRCRHRTPKQLGSSSISRSRSRSELVLLLLCRTMQRALQRSLVVVLARTTGDHHPLGSSAPGILKPPLYSSRDLPSAEHRPGSRLLCDSGAGTSQQP